MRKSSSLVNEAHGQYSIAHELVQLVEMKCQAYVILQYQKSYGLIPKPVDFPFPFQIMSFHHGVGRFISTA
jgi:hypothetical protein